jgi:phosphate starvation-inducible PhoH-like protein
MKKILTETHSRYYNVLRAQNAQSVVIGVGPPGSGKTQIACSVAMESYLTKKVDKIFITRPAVTVDENLGFLPGKIGEKMTPYMMPIYDAFRNHISADKLNTLLKSDAIEVGPLSFIRGRTFKNCVFIADEMQNSTAKQMKTLLTRAGDNCNMVLTGDLDQSDIHGQNGLQDLLSRIELKYLTSDESVFEVVYFTGEDILRSPLVKKIDEFYKHI